MVNENSHLRFRTNLDFAQKFIIFVVQTWRHLGKAGCLHYFYAIFRLKIGKNPRRIRKNIRRKGKIVSIVGKIRSILRARMSLVIYKISTLNVKVS